MIEFLDSVCTK